MNIVALAPWTERFEIADQLLEGRESMTEPQDLPGRYGRVVKSIDRVLKAMQGQSVVAGGWAVWRYGYEGRLTKDIDVVIASNELDEFLAVAAVSGFEVLKTQKGQWPKLLHRETLVEVDILPEGESPGTHTRPAPTTIPHPAELGARAEALTYVTLPALIELKLASFRERDKADVIVLIQTCGDRLADIRSHLQEVHSEYVRRWDHLVEQANEELNSVR